MENKTTNPLTDLVRSQEEEVEKYKWIESEKEGRDIGTDRAIREWLQRHFSAWKRFQWRKEVDQALKSDI